MTQIRQMNTDFNTLRPLRFQPLRLCGKNQPQGREDFTQRKISVKLCELCGSVLKKKHSTQRHKAHRVSQRKTISP